MFRSQFAGVVKVLGVFFSATHARALSLRFVVKHLAWKWAEEREYEPKAVKFKGWAGLVSARNLT